jgi:hypothetical protein
MSNASQQPQCPYHGSVRTQGVKSNHGPRRNTTNHFEPQNTSAPGARASVSWTLVMPMALDGLDSHWLVWPLARENPLRSASVMCAVEPVLDACLAGRWRWLLRHLAKSTARGFGNSSILNRLPLDVGSILVIRHSPEPRFGTSLTRNHDYRLRVQRLRLLHFRFRQ